MLRMDEAKIMAQVESETHKWTGVAVRSWQDIVMFVQRDGRDGAAVMQSGDTCIDDIHSVRLDSKVETGQSVLYKNPIVTECETIRFTSWITERVALLGCAWRFGGGARL